MSTEQEPNGSGAEASGAVFETDVGSASLSVVRPLGFSSMECGYCKGERAAIMKPPRTAQDCSKAYGMLADFMAPGAYEKFLYRGWRRSGIHLYKPSNFESCCPTLTLRLWAPGFRPTKSQSKVRRRMENLLSPPVSTASLRSGPTASLSNSYSFSREKKEKTSILRLEQIIQESGVLDRLQEATRRALSTTNSKIPNAQTTVTWKTYLESVGTISYRLRPPSKQNMKERKFVLSSTICARLAGKFKVDRENLLCTVVQALSDNLITMNGKHSQEENEKTMTTGSQQGLANGNTNHLTSAITIKSIQPHIKSGQILVEVQLPKSSSESPSSLQPAASYRMQIDREDDSMRDAEDDLVALSAPVNSIRSTKATSDSADKLGSWYQRTTGKPLTIDKRQLRVKTLPAHKSALDPRVHCLYAHYQNIVHQDPDPFQMPDDEVQSSDSDCPVNSVQSNATISPNKKTKDVSMTENDVTEIGDAASDEPTDPMASIADLDWGPNPPKYFTKEIFSMLKDYLAPHSLPVQRALLNSYYSFYQFLVESPFDPPSTHQQSSSTLEPASFRDKSNQTRVNSVQKEGTFDAKQRGQGASSAKQNLPCGTYHQHYLIGDELIAVGVVDILPQGLSSVYLYYHPGFSHTLVALGKLAILKEIEFTKSLGRPYYYLGYYIESCRKMRYKADYQPSEMLCPVTYQWVDCSKAVPMIRAVPQNVCRLAEEDMPTGATTSEADGTNDSTAVSTNEVLPHIPMDIGAGMILSLDMLQENCQQIVRPILQDLAQEAGPNLSRQCLVKFT